MKKLLTIVGICLWASLSYAQGVRFGDSNPTQTAVTVPGTSGQLVKIVPNAVISFCGATANAVPCTNQVLTYTDATLTTPCQGGTQVVLAGTQNCIGTTDSLGNWGVWVPSGSYSYTITSNGISSGPYPAIIISGGGFVCGTTPTPGLLYWDGLHCQQDGGATFDPINLVWNFEAIVSAGTITAPKFTTSGAGGILELQAQSPPSSVPVGKFDVILNSNTGLIDCFNNALAHCFNGIQAIASGTAALSTSSVGSGGCNITTVSATGVLTSSKIVATPNVDPTGVTGYGPSASGSLYVQAWPTANNVNFKVCNNTGSPITPSALTLTWTAF